MDLSTIILVAAMMPMAAALDKTGAAGMIVDFVLGLTGEPYAITAVVFMVTALLTSIMSNTAYASPVGTPPNTMLYSPDNYKILSIWF